MKYLKSRNIFLLVSSTIVFILSIIIEVISITSLKEVKTYSSLINLFVHISFFCWLYLFILKNKENKSDYLILIMLISAIIMNLLFKHYVVRMNQYELKSYCQGFPGLFHLYKKPKYYPKYYYIYFPDLNLISSFSILLFSLIHKQERKNINKYKVKLFDKSKVNVIVVPIIFIIGVVNFIVLLFQNLSLYLIVLLISIFLLLIFCLYILFFKKKKQIQDLIPVFYLIVLIVSFINLLATKALNFDVIKTYRLSFLYITIGSKGANVNLYTFQCIVSLIILEPYLYFRLRDLIKNDYEVINVLK